jgi:hypothetical protein
MAAAIIQGAIIVALTVFLVFSPEVSRVIASGGAGTWFTIAQSCNSFSVFNAGNCVMLASCYNTNHEVEVDAKSDFSKL